MSKRTLLPVVLRPDARLCLDYACFARDCAVLLVRAYRFDFRSVVEESGVMCATRDSTNTRSTPRERRDKVVEIYLPLLPAIAGTFQESIPRRAMDMDDAVQALAVELIKSAERFETYLWNRCREVLIDAGRRKGLVCEKTVAPDEFPEFRSDSGAESMEERIDRERRQMQLAAALDKLPPRQKKVLEFRTSGRSFDEIGRLTRTSNRTAKRDATTGIRQVAAAMAA